MSAAERDALARIRSQMSRDDARVRAVLTDHPTALAEYDAAIAHVNSGASALEGLWHALSPLQRATVERMGVSDARAVRVSAGRHDIGGWQVSSSTLAALARRDLVLACGADEDRQGLYRATVRLYDLKGHRVRRH